MLTAFGTSKTSVQRVFQEDFTLITPEQFRGKTLLSTENPHGKCYMHMQSEWFKKQLLPGAGLDELQNKYFRHLKHIMNIEYLQGDFSSLQNSSKRPRSVTVYLGKLNRWVLSYATFRAFFGKALFEIEPMFAQIYQKWEDDSWKVFYNYPYALAKDLHHARTQAIEVLAKYYELPLRERETCWLFRIMDIEMQAIGLSRKDRAGMVMMICWA
jgi:hypothetical protein